ncbi:BMP family ABC transporter substrate-binding protein [Alkalibaculum sp. M08DMB]|uniref:BMP family ABC transporter substrate-binding protein n=1 Tax=Alkalibaculum sporogenes TaxID=2655001 RepID=A0A6A7K9S8_9FIRM|nr:BMP family ABC transporter substrate-binding protein [Alkalibaculum sporogenes]MPW26220.1 BMP family ABC transporter substrate-binding protein [Alkalibaculum sporogenes]
MKRFSILLLIAALLAATSLGCTQDSAGSDAEEVVAGFIYVGPVNDGGYTTAHDNGRIYLEERLGDKVKTIYKENVPEEKGEVVKVIREMVDQGANIIFTTSFGHMDGTLEAAKEFPKVQFAHCSGYQTAENMTNYFGRMYEARYLSGIVAGLKTESNKIAYVGAFPIPEVIRGINAFTLGVKSVNPDAEVHVRWTNTWYDPAAEKAAADALLAEGSDVTSQHQDSTATMIAAQENGVFSIGYNVSAAESVPDAYITAPMWNWGIYYADAVQDVIDGTWTNTPYWEGMDSGIVYLDELTGLAPENASDEVGKAQQEIISGNFKVFAGEIKDQDGEVRVKDGDELSDEELLSFDWFVEGVVGRIPSN